MNLGTIDLVIARDIISLLAKQLQVRLSFHLESSLSFKSIMLLKNDVGLLGKIIFRGNCFFLN